VRNITILAALLASATNVFSQTVDRASLWPDTVRRGEMIRQVRGLGEITASRTLVLRIAETQVGDIKKGQPVTAETQGSQRLTGVVDSVGTSPSNGTIEVRVALRLPSELTAGTQVDGIVDIERLSDVVMVGRPVMARPQSENELYKIDPDGAHATRVRVKFGRSSVNTIEVLEGLKPGDRVILSDTSAFDRYQRIDLR
jgi:HlyD family secretion protein